MKCFMLFFLGIGLGFFDVYFLFCFVLFFVFVFSFSMGGLYFGGVFFSDSISFFLVFLCVLLFCFCFFSSVIDKWGSDFYLSFYFFLGSIFFFLFLSFSLFSIFGFYVCFEFIFIIMFVFLLGWGYSPERLQASFYMVFYTLVVSFPFLLYLFVSEDMNFSLKFFSFHGWSSYWWVFIFLVFLVKLPVYMVHLWLPKAHVEAPVSGSMVLAGALLKLGGYGFYRFSFFSLGAVNVYFGYLLSVGLVGGLFSCFLCMRQCDLKAFVAYSSICHMGFALAGIYGFTNVSLVGAVYMFVAHGFCSSCLFYLLYVVYERYHSRSFFVVKGIGLMAPSMILLISVFSVLNMGVPPSFSFFSEVSLIVGVLGCNFYSFLVGGMLLFFAGVYGILFFVVSCHGVPLMEGVSFSISLREFLNAYGHFYPLGFLSLFSMFFFC